MSFEAIYNIAQAEAEGKAAVTAAEQKAKGLIAEADRLADELAVKKAVLLAKAEAKLDKAASLVVERIVNN